MNIYISFYILFYGSTEEFALSSVKLSITLDLEVTQTSFETISH